LLLEYFAANSRILIGKIKKSHKIRITSEDLSKWKVHVTSDDFGTILVQLTALGLITKSERKRSVSNRGTYWALTPYGETRTIQLRAIKKDHGATSISESTIADESTGDDKLAARVYRTFTP
jgi:hypothetical protein